jgi:hypothetical protein
MAAVKKGDRPLDLTISNELVARWLAAQGVSMIATDGVYAMVECARSSTATMRERGKSTSDEHISFRVLDMTDRVSMKEFVALEGTEKVCLAFRR